MAHEMQRGMREGAGSLKWSGEDRGRHAGLRRNLRSTSAGGKREEKTAAEDCGCYVLRELPAATTFP